MLELLSILLECAIVFLAVLIAKERKKNYGYTLALTFALYVVFDAARKFNLEMPSGFLDLLFFIATLSAFWSVWSIYKEKRK